MFPEKVSSVEELFRSVVQQLDLDCLRISERRIILAVLLVAVVGLSMNYNVAPVAAQECGRILLAEPGWQLEGSDGAAEDYQDIESQSLVGVDTIQVTLDFHGNTFLTAEESHDATVIIFDDNGGWYTAVLAQDDFNSFDGVKKINIPLSAFQGINETEGKPFTPADGVGTLHARIWLSTPFQMDIKQVVALDSQDPSCTQVLEQADYSIHSTTETNPQLNPTAVPTPLENEPTENDLPFEIKSASLMKVTKDRMRDPFSNKEIEELVNQAKILGANMLSLETPYDSPPGTDSLSYTYAWIAAMRAQGMNVWHRHMGSQFEGIYDEPKVLRVFGDNLPEKVKSVASEITSVPFERLDQYLVQIYEYIISHPDMFAAGDVFTPAPEPDSRGVVGITNCDDGMCMFSSVEDFNQWLVDADNIAKEAFQVIGVENVRVGMYGFSGFTTAVLNNGDWKKNHTFLSCAAIDSMDGIVAVDHYTDSQSMMPDLQRAVATLAEACPDEFNSLAIGEWGTEDPAEVAKVFQIFRDLGIRDVNYWPLAESPEALINDGEPTTRFPMVQDAYSS